VNTSPGCGVVSLTNLLSTSKTVQSVVGWFVAVAILFTLFCKYPFPLEITPFTNSYVAFSGIFSTTLYFGAAPYHLNNPEFHLPAP